jgi:hypothetical protein
MESGADRVLEFRARIEKNRQVFMLQHAYAYYAFFGLLEAFDSIGRRIQTGRDSNSKTWASAIPLVLLMERQAMNAFEALASYRLYEAWVLIRPALESALYLGKWEDDPDHAAIWSARAERRTEYIKAFTGKGLVSQSLPRAAEIIQVLAHLNDEFVHANEPYYERHIVTKHLPDDTLFVGVDFFDADEDIEPHALAFLHLVAVLIDSVDSMFATALPNTMPHIPQAPRIGRELAERTSRLRAANDRHEKVLRELGLWFV